MAQSRGGVDGAIFWLAGAVRVLQKEVRELRGLLADHHQDEVDEAWSLRQAKHHEDMMDEVQLVLATSNVTLSQVTQYIAPTTVVSFEILVPVVELPHVHTQCHT